MSVILCINKHTLGIINIALEYAIMDTCSDDKLNLSPTAHLNSCSNPNNNKNKDKCIYIQSNCCLTGLNKKT